MMNNEQVEIVTKSVEGGIERTTYREVELRSKKLANALKNKLGVRFGDRVGQYAVRHQSLARSLTVVDPPNYNCNHSTDL
jgi:acyl-coenzyme A synthetase/AMP-(fatty) acid ligase